MMQIKNFKLYISIFLIFYPKKEEYNIKFFFNKKYINLIFYIQSRYEILLYNLNIDNYIIQFLSDFFDYFK